MSFDIGLDTEKLLYNTRFNFNVMALTTNGCLNTGNMIRTANLTGAKRYFIFGKRNYDKRSAMGLHKHMTIIRISKDFPNGIEETEINYDLINKYTKIKLDKEDYEFDTELFIKIMIKYNMVPIFIEQSKGSIKLSNINWKYQLEELGNKEPCLILGNESYGIPKNILETKALFTGSFCIELIQTGIANSYNVSNCAAIIMNSLFNHYYKKIIDKFNINL